MVANDPSAAFRKQVGFALLTVKNSQPSVHVRDVLGEGVDVVSGELLLRDGVYRTKRDVSLQMFGIYGWVEGKVLMVSDVHSEVVSSVLHRLYDVVRSLGAAAVGAVSPSGGEGTPSGTAASIVALNVSREDFSTACGTKLEVVLSTLDTETLFSKAINYTLLVTAVSFLQVLCLLPQMESTATQAAAARVSLLVVGMQSVADSYLCLGHLTMGIAVHTLFNAFATAAFFKFIIFSVFQMRYLLLIWRAKRPAGFTHGWESMRRELSMLYTRFYGSLLLGILLLYELQNHVQLFLFALYSFWTPQIILSATHDYRRPLHPLYILGMSVTRLAIPLYFYACPVNFLHIQPRPAVAAALVAWMAVQAGVLASQHVWGPRWFVPKRFLPEKYDYYRPVTLPPPD
eukprot:contig_27114_g6677